MAKLSEIQIDPNKYKGRGLRPWTDERVVSNKNKIESKHEKNKMDPEKTLKDNKVTKKVTDNEKGVTKRVQKSIQKDDNN